MKPEVTLKYLSYLRNKKANNEGFTLIELLVVVIIIGVLAAVALPNLLNQVGKARETELKNAAGTVVRSQQAYHFERRNFADTAAQLGLDTAFANSDYLDPVPGGGSVAGDGIFIATTVSASTTSVVTNNSDFKTDGTRAYSGAIGFNITDATYNQVLCQSNEITATGVTPIVTSAAAIACTGESGVIK